MCDALEHFMQALNIIMQRKSLTEKEENVFVHELSQCYRIEHIVAQVPSIEVLSTMNEIVDSVLYRCATSIKTTDDYLQIDEDVRICYAVLHMDSPKEIIKFLDKCKEKYPKSIIFFELSAIANCWLKQYDRTLYETNVGLQLDPNNSELLFYKAAALRLLNNNMDETITAYQAFLTAAPVDDRHVPESYYAMAYCYFIQKPHEILTDHVKIMYQQGEEAEKRQLPCLLPYESNSKIFLKSKFERKSSLNIELSDSVVDNKSQLKNSRRIEMIVKHRQWQKTLLECSTRFNGIIHATLKPHVQQITVKSLVGLKSITIREMNPIKNHVYTGYVLSVRIIEEAYSWKPSIHLIIEDDNFDCERMCIYNFPTDDGEYLTHSIFKIGSKMSIINPYLRLCASENKPMIRVDDFSSILMGVNDRSV
ncbi:hypothetical protein I4U23_021932 [Adineta vaga]|nr:hypothetical protein I4U23_021932 [Adineta vaga]